MAWSLPLLTNFGAAMALALIGPGKYSLDRAFGIRLRHWLFALTWINHVSVTAAALFRPHLVTDIRAPFHRTGSLPAAHLTNHLVWYNGRTMAEHRTSIDITDMPDLIDIVEEIRRTKQPRVLRRDAEDVALVMPLPVGPDAASHSVSLGITAALAAGGSWKGLIDGEELKAQLHTARGSDRSPPPLSPTCWTRTLSLTT